MSAPSVSVLVPTLNGADDLRRLLAALDGQEYQGAVERVAIDSSSDDDTVAVLEDGRFDVEVIPRAEFGHGRTRNALARRANGEYLVFLSQDAVPDGKGFLAAMVAAASRPGVAGVTARVLPHADDDAQTARTVREAPEASASADERGGAGAPFEGLDGPARAYRMRFNDVASCMSRAVLLEHPLPEVPFGEDAAWAATVLSAGLRIRHEPAAIVRHAHRYGPRSAWRRYAQDAAFHRAFHGFRVRPHIGSVLKGWAYELRRDLVYVARNGGWAGLLRAPLLRLAQTSGQYAGGRSVDGAWSAALREGRVQPLAPPPSTDASASMARTS
ncbi:MAG: glycosyltransferase [Planctomycetota bacterium]|nr:glycosyltransferase [Planctomycetota bacterium]